MQINAEFQEEKIKKELDQNFSAKKIMWSEKTTDKNLELSLTKKFNLNPIISKILVARNVNLSNFEKFHNPSIREIMPDPSTLDEMNLATKKIVDFILNKKKIGIFGDYDVDGSVSTAMICSYFRDIGVDFEYYIPDRLKEGYGPNNKAFDSLRKKDCELIITLDCGTSAVHEIEFIKKKNVEVIVVDHHKQSNILPEACAIINPNKKTDTSGLSNLCAAGVTFFLLVSLNRELKKYNFFGSSFPNLLNYLDIVALATICDVVQLDLMNRAFVKQGLKVCNLTKNTGLLSLINESSIKETINSYHLGFIIGPRINAGGRVGKSSVGTDLLLCKDQTLSGVMASKLGEYNKLRKRIELEVERKAFSQVDSNKKILCVSSDDWHPGVIGIVASKLCESFNKPAIVISENKDLCKASCRSTSVCDIGNLILEAIQNNIIQSGGGHKMAAGFTIKKEKIDLLKDFLEKKKIINDLSYSKFYDYDLNLSSIDHDLFHSIQKIAPFGQGNPTPKFRIKNCFINFYKIVGDYHMSCVVEDIYGNKFKVICFNALKNNIYEYLESSISNSFDVIAVLKNNRWNGDENIEVQIEDLIPN